MAGAFTWAQEHQGAFWLATGQHLTLSMTALAFVIALGLPLAVLLARVPRLAGVTVGLVNVLRTIPSLALLAMMLPFLGTGFLPSVVALTLYGAPAVLINAYTGLREVDVDVMDAARGQGLSAGQILRRIQFPLAAPVIFAGVRTAAVQIVSAATLAAFIGGGGLGELITAGMGTLDIPQLVTGGLAVAVLAIATELGFGGMERLTTRSLHADVR
jgi:osmoprotectant transport system permease protein